MKHLINLFGITLLFFSVVSCSEDILQNDQNLIDHEENALKSEDKVASDDNSLSLKCTTTDNCKSETAWAKGKRYTPRGNWATYTPLPTNPPDANGLLGCYSVWAGKNMYAGYVCFYEEGDDIRIFIGLFECWSFQDVSEPIKIQGYNDPPPSENPNPGGFTTYKGDGEILSYGYQVIVPKYNFYGIHLDVQNCCIDEE